MDKVSQASRTLTRDYYRKLRAEGRTAEESLRAVRSFDNFRQRLRAMVAENKRRSKAARKGWKTRRATA